MRGVGVGGGGGENQNGVLEWGFIGITCTSRQLRAPLVVTEVGAECQVCEK